MKTNSKILRLTLATVCLLSLLAPSLSLAEEGEIGELEKQRLEARQENQKKLEELRKEAAQKRQEAGEKLLENKAGQQRSPTGTLANLKEKRATSTRPSEINFCQRLEKTLEETRKKVERTREQLSGKKERHLETFENRWDKRKDKLEETRENADDRREKRYEALFERAETEGQKTAVEEFKNSVEALVGARKEAVDSAIKSFRQELESLTKTQTDGLKAAADVLRASTEATMKKAKDSCAAGADSETIKKTLQSEMKSAQDVFSESRKSLGNIQPKLEELKNKRNEAIKEAAKDFEAGLKSAVEKLKIAFPKPSLTPTATPTPAASPT